MIAPHPYRSTRGEVLQEGGSTRLWNEAVSYVVFIVGGGEENDQGEDDGPDRSDSSSTRVGPENV
jgi:hypothetical protein